MITKDGDGRRVNDSTDVTCVADELAMRVIMRMLQVKLDAMNSMHMQNLEMLEYAGQVYEELTEASVAMADAIASMVRAIKCLENALNEPWVR